jgi:leader peptidase (prepilin peptidase)/N-methyltransferase
MTSASDNIAGRQQAADFSAGRARTAPVLADRSPRVFIDFAAAALLAAILLPIADDRVLVGAVFGLIMMSIAAVDACQFIIPDYLTFAALALGGLHVVTATPGDFEAPLVDATLRGAATAGLFLMMQTAYRWWRRREGMGLGDVKLAAVAGVWLDWTTIPVAIELAAGAGLAFYFFGGAMARRPMRLTSKLPFGLFFAPAIWLSWLLQSLLE